MLLRLFLIFTLVVGGQAAQIATWAWNNMMQLAWVKDGRLLMGTCSWNKDEWVFNQSLPLPDDFADGSSIAIFYRQAEGGNFTGMLYQNTDNNIVSIQYPCNGINVGGPMNPGAISQKAGATQFDVLDKTSISVQSATDQGLLSVFYQGTNGSALMTYGAFVKGDFHNMNRVTPLDYPGSGIVSMQINDSYIGTVYAVNSSQIFYGFANLGSDTWDIYGYPNALSENATNLSTNETDFDATGETAPYEIYGYDTKYNGLAATFDRAGENGVWIFYIGADNQVYTLTNVKSGGEYHTNATESMRETQNFDNLYSGFGEANRTYGLTVYLDFQMNYSRCYWVDGNGSMVYIERDASDVANQYNAKVVTVDFLNTTSDTASSSSSTSDAESNSKSSGLSNGAKIGVGVGVGVGGALLLLSLLFFFYRYQKAKKAKAAQNVPPPITTSMPPQPPPSEPSPYKNLYDMPASPPPPSVGGVSSMSQSINGQRSTLVSMCSPELGSGGFPSGPPAELPARQFMDPQELHGSVPESRAG